MHKCKKKKKESTRLKWFCGLRINKLVLTHQKTNILNFGMPRPTYTHRGQALPSLSDLSPSGDDADSLRMRQRQGWLSWYNSWYIKASGLRAQCVWCWTHWLAATVKIWQAVWLIWQLLAPDGPWYGKKTQRAPTRRFECTFHFKPSPQDQWGL